MSYCQWRSCSLSVGDLVDAARTLLEHRIELCTYCYPSVENTRQMFNKRCCPNTSMLDSHISGLDVRQYYCKGHWGSTGSVPYLSFRQKASHCDTFSVDQWQTEELNDDIEGSNSINPFEFLTASSSNEISDGWPSKSIVDFSGASFAPDVFEMKRRLKQSK